jgi:predicted O-methyltransferase YrrM
VSVNRPDDSAAATSNGLCSLNDETLLRLLEETSPSAQATSAPDLNVGFGFLYYSMGRILRPKLAVVLGSKMGFSAISIALAIRDNLESGQLILVDASLDDSSDGPDGMGGVGFWHQRERVAELLERFGVAGVMEVRVTSTAEFAAMHARENLPSIDLLLIDADHSYQGFKADFETYTELISKSGVILCHDSEVPDGFAGYSFGIRSYLRDVVMKNSEFEAISLPVWPGLGIVRKAGAMTYQDRPAPVMVQRFFQRTYDLIPLPLAWRERLRDQVLRLLRSSFPGSY